MKKHLILYLFEGVCSLFIFSACISSAKQIPINSDAYLIDLDTVEPGRDFKLTNIFDSVSVIPLDNSEVVIGKLSRIDTYKDRLIVLDAEYAKGVFVFDRNGRLLHKIGNVGFGPEEYASCTDFAIDRKLGSVYLYDRMGNRIYVYDVDTGKYQRTIHVEPSNVFNRIWHNGANLYAVNTYFRPKEKNTPCYILNQLDKETGEVIGEWLDVESFNKGWKTEFITSNLFYRVDEDRDLFTYGLADTILCFKEEGFFPYMIFAGDKVVKSGDISEEERDISLHVDTRIKMFMEVQRRLGFQRNKIISISNLYESAGCLYFNYTTWPRFMAKYNLRNNEISVYVNVKDDLLFLSNPYKYSTTAFLTSDTKGVYYRVEAEALPNLKSCLRDGMLSDRIKNKNALSSITEDSNPVILYYEYKSK